MSLILVQRLRVKSFSHFITEGVVHELENGRNQGNRVANFLVSEGLEVLEINFRCGVEADLCLEVDHQVTHWDSELLQSLDYSELREGYLRGD